MKLTTDVSPRKDGTVKAMIPATRDSKAVEYVFKAGADGALSCDVPDEDHAEYLLDTGNFFPEGDRQEPKAKAKAEDDETTGNMNAGPIEANTPPKPKAAKAKAEPKPKAASGKKRAATTE